MPGSGRAEDVIVMKQINVNTTVGQSESKLIGAGQSSILDVAVENELLSPGRASISSIPEYADRTDVPVIEELPNIQEGYVFYELKFRGSILKRVWIPTIVSVGWAFFWLALYFWAGVTGIAVSNALIVILSVVMSLLLVFRTNTAYDRYWQARTYWSTVSTQIRNLSRFVWFLTKSNTPKDEEEKRGIFNLLLAYAVALKHDLRREKGLHHQDLRSLLVHIEAYKPGLAHPLTDHLPLDLTFHMSSYFKGIRDRELLDPTTFGQVVTAICTLVDSASHLERIRDSPIPLAYCIHLKQTLILYLMFLPFQLIITMGWFTVVVVGVVTFALLGIDAIALEIENPFGYNSNDLPMDSFCEKLRLELIQIQTYPSSLTSSSWGIPVDMSFHLQVKSKKY